MALLKRLQTGAAHELQSMSETGDPPNRRAAVPALASYLFQFGPLHLFGFFVSPNYHHVAHCI